MSIRGNGGTPRGHGDAKKAPKEKKARRHKWEIAPIEYPYDQIPEAQQFLTCSSCTADRMIDAVEKHVAEERAAAKEVERNAKGS